jgi:hypothetical protein
MEAQEAVLSVTERGTVSIPDSPVEMFSIHYPALKGTLRIYFESHFPHEIMGWQEVYSDGFGNNKKC